MKKEKEKSLKKLQEELLELVKEKYYDKDEQISQCVDSINKKYQENLLKAQKRKEQKLSLGEKIKKVLIGISLETLQLCDKLIVKEKVAVEIMGYTPNNDLSKAEKEIKDGISKWIK